MAPGSAAVSPTARSLYGLKVSVHWPLQIGTSELNGYTGRSRGPSTRLASADNQERPYGRTSSPSCDVPLEDEDKLYLAPTVLTSLVEPRL